MESEYLSNRLSSSGILDYPDSSTPNCPPLQPGSHPLQSSLIQSAPEDRAIRTRTKSSPYFDLPAEAGPSRIPVPSSSYRPSPSSSRRPSYNDSLEESRIPRLQPPLRRPSGTTPPLPDTGDRTLTRPRSKTTLAARPDIHRTGSDSSSDRQYVPSGTPIPSARNRQRSTSVSPIKGDPSGPGGTAETRDNNLREVLSHRESFDLSAQVYPDTLLRDELPPFRLAPEEAMQIARHGYDLDHKQDMGDEGGIGDEDDIGIKRKRTESMYPAKQPGSQARRYDVVKKENMPRSGTGSSLGLGRAPSASRSGFPSKTTPLRSATTSNPLRSGAGLSSSQTSTSRSVSAGLGPTPPRMGVAAHFVPPESTYTPPKGTNWDDVVLPVIAKKMGLTGSTEKRVGVEDMEEGDLAVEWDKNGTPMKWVKRSHMGTSPRIDNEKATEVGDVQDAYDYNEVAIPRSRSAFSPTFEPSPDNPLHHPQPIRPNRDHYPSSSDITPTPTPKPQKAYEPQIRTTNAFDTSYSTSTAPPSPAPFSNLPRRPSTGPLALRPENIDIQSSTGQKDGEIGRISRKPSFIVKQSGQVVSRQQSAVSLRTSNRDDASRLALGTSPGSGHAVRHQQSAGLAIRETAAEGISYCAPQSGEGNRSGQRPEVRDKDTHGKGCGCVIM